MKVGVLARLDASGLGSQSRLMVDLLEPEAVVVVDMGRASRHPTVELDHPNVLRAQWEARGSQTAAKSVAQHFGDCDVVWSAETTYWTGLPRRLGKKRVCLHINAELFRDTRERNVFPALPTVWMSQAKTYPVVPHPSPLGDPTFESVRRANVERAGPAKRVLHIAAPAMLDRNGTDAMLAGLGQYTGPPFTLFVAGAGLDKGKQLRLPGKVGRVRVERVGPVVERSQMFAGIDLLVLPRRYAGLCLPAQEAAVAGVPVLMSDVSPQDEWAGVDSSVSAHRATVHPMRGGHFKVHQPDPHSLARRLLAYTGDDGQTRAAWQAEALGWAEATSWERVRPLWDEWLLLG